MKMFDYLLTLWRQIFSRAVWQTSKTTALKPRKRNNPRQTFSTGAHYNLGDLLDSLCDYHDVVKTLKMHDPDAYDYYVRVGCPVVSHEMRVDGELGAHWRDGSKRPALLMIHYSLSKTKPGHHWHNPAFMLLRKIRMSPSVQFTNADLYECIIFYREINSQKIVAGMPYHIAVDQDGNLSLMRVLKVMPARTYSKKMRTLKGQIRGRQSPVTNHSVQRWGVPEIVIDWAKDHNTTPAEITTSAFRMAAGFSETVNAGLLIRARKDSVVAAFSIDLLRTPYFFKDRDKTVTKNGRTKRIFHIVRTHQRKSGSFVKTHFRGLRQFNWHGHAVTISMPGFHHKIVSAWPATAITDDDPDRGEFDKLVTAKEAGKIFDDHMNR